MKKILPILVLSTFIFSLFITAVSPVYAVDQPPGQQIQPNQQQQPSADVGEAPSRWVIDPEVTFIGKNAARAGDLLDWALKNYNWVCVSKANPTDPKVGHVCDDTANPIAKYWSTIVLYIVVPLLFFVILVTSLVIIITRGKSLTIMKFIPRFIAVVLLIVFSYSILQFLYQITDMIQGFFLRSTVNNPCPPNCISQRDLLYVGWKYKSFIGLRLLGDQYAESAFISLLLTKLTALTYFVMVFLLLVRKIILWFFIIVSPIFPILLLYYPVRNTAKIWIGEFFRWVLYAPLFAIFLNGLVYLWKNSIPLQFVNVNRFRPDMIEYPTAVNILLGGPREQVTPTNSVNLVETFALYVVSLIMLWIVILLPWILLQIFLDYASNFAPGDTAVMKTLVSMATNPKNPPPVGTGPQPGGEGAAISLPFSKKFTIPKDIQPGPTGAAKEIQIGNANIDATFSQPANLSTATFSNTNLNTAQVNAQVVALANVKVPTLRDIAKYDTALISRDQSKQVEVTRITQQLEKIANPTTINNSVEQNQINQVYQKSDQGNIVANNIMNAASIASRNRSQVSNKDVKNVLSQIANPATSSTSNTQATVATNREKLSKLNEMLVKESKNTSKNNQSELAKSILKVNEKSTDKEIANINNQLKMASNTQLGKTINSAINQGAQSSTQIKSVLKQVANPNSVVHTADKQSVTKMKATLERASKEGNDLATSILKVNDKTSVEEIEALQTRIMDARKKGEPIATQLSALAQKTTTMPQSNRVQTVSKADYQAVKDMWKQNYNNLEVPQGMAGTRTDWIKDDIASIDETIANLTSTDEAKVKEGMDQVSSLLPFLMMGGFTQTEIVEYLRAKQDAAKEVSKSLSTEEEDMVSISRKTTQAEKSMVASMEMGSTSANQQSGSASDDDESPLSSLSQTTITNNSTTTLTPEVNHEILNMVNLKLPKLQDIARFETQALKRDETGRAEMRNVQQVLQKIANPQKIENDAERAQFEKVRNTLIEHKQKGDKTAQALLDASIRSQGKTSEQAKSILSQIANPTLSTAEADKQRFSELHEAFERASNEGNDLAASILKVDDKTPVEEIEALQSKITDAKKKGEPIATQLSALGQKTTLPQDNSVQKVSQEDYQAVRDMWKQNYNNLEVPEGMAGKRIDWIKDDIASIDETIANLTSTDDEKVKEGMDQVSSLLPFLMMGGFSQSEIVAYLRAKQDAAKDVAKSISVDEENMVSVGTKTAQADKSMVTSMEMTSTPATSVQQSGSIADEEDDSPLSSLSQVDLKSVSANNELLNMVNLKLPGLQDIVRYETQALKKDQTGKAEVQNVQQVLEKIANPQKIENSTERAQFEKVRNTLLEQKQKGDKIAQGLLSASLRSYGNTSESAKSILSQIANPTLASVEADKKRYSELHETLVKASGEGNQLASAILSTKDETSLDAIQQLQEKLKEEKAKGEPIADSILSTMPDDTIVPESNDMQSIADEDYADVKKLWIENYRTLPVPAEYGTQDNGRIVWISADVKNIEETMLLLNDADSEKREEGMQKVSGILPILLLGGFTHNEIVGYLKAKVEAGQFVIAELQKVEEGKVSVPSSTTNDANTKEQKAEDEANK